MNLKDKIKLKGKNVTIVPLELDHHDDLVESVKDGELWNLWFSRVPSPNEMKGEIIRRLELLVNQSMIPFTIIENKTQKAVGMTTYCNIDFDTKRLEIGWTWYRKSVQKTAVNTETKLLLLTYAFEVLNCVAVEFRTSFFNSDSRRAIERLGAKYDGILRNHRMTKNGIISDTRVYSILDSEWSSVKANLKYKLL